MHRRRIPAPNASHRFSADDCDWTSTSQPRSVSSPRDSTELSLTEQTRSVTPRSVSENGAFHRPTHSPGILATHRPRGTDRPSSALTVFLAENVCFHRVFHRVLQNSAHRAGQNDRTECYLHSPTEYKFTDRAWQRLTDRAQFVISSVGTIPCFKQEFADTYGPVPKGMHWSSTLSSVMNIEQGSSTWWWRGVGVGVGVL